MANYDGVLAALGASPDQGKSKLQRPGKYASMLQERDHIVSITSAQGAVKGGGDDETRRDPYMSVFRRAPLPFVGLRNEPRKTRMWVVDREHQDLGGDEDGSDRVLEHVPHGVLSSLDTITGEGEPQRSGRQAGRRALCTSPLQRREPTPQPSTSTALARPEDIRNDWLVKRRRYKTRKRQPLPDLPQAGGTGREPPPEMPANPRSEVPVRIKNRATPSVLLSQDIDTIISQYDTFGSRFQALSSKDQDTWRVLWQANNPHLRASLDKYCKAGLFPETVRSKRYNDLFQQGIFITPHHHLHPPPSPPIANLL